MSVYVEKHATQSKKVAAIVAKDRSRSLSSVQHDNSFEAVDRQRDDSPKAKINIPATSRDRVTLANLVYNVWRFLVTSKPARFRATYHRPSQAPRKALQRNSSSKSTGSGLW